jgi:hypothetical protein
MKSGYLPNLWTADKKGVFDGPDRSALIEHARKTYGIEPHIYDSPPSPYFHVLLAVADNDPTKIEPIRDLPLLTVLAAYDARVAARRAE